MALLAGWSQAKECWKNEVQLALREEAWVGVETARVQVHVEATADPNQAGTLQKETLERLRKLIPEAQDRTWRITSADLSRDPSGLERWRLEAEIRVPAAYLPGLQDKAARLSTPGLHFTPAIDWTPALSEVEAAKAKARQALYRRAEEEAKRLNETLGFGYRVADIRFSEPGISGPFAAKRALAAEAVELPRMEKQIVEAWVTLREPECPAVNAP
nr:hypothetical conserved protein [uncultured Gammaproteobacteria bacterium]